MLDKQSPTPKYHIGKLQKYHTFPGKIAKLPYPHTYTPGQAPYTLGMGHPLLKCLTSLTLRMSNVPAKDRCAGD